MVEFKWGRIIDVLNTVAKAPKANSGPISVSRAAKMALIRVSEGAAHNIPVNSPHVGLIESDQWVRKHAQQQGDEIFEDFPAGMAADLQPSRVRTAAEFANMTCLLASVLGSYVTGTSINVDGNLCPVM